MASPQVSSWPLRFPHLVAGAADVADAGAAEQQHRLLRPAELAAQSRQHRLPEVEAELAAGAVDVAAVRRVELLLLHRRISDCLICRCSAAQKVGNKLTTG